MRSKGAPRLVRLVPLLWLVVFFAIPFLIVFRISLSETAIAQPPYQPVFELARGWDGVRDFVSALSLHNYSILISDSLYVFSYLKSLEVAAVSTAILLLVGFPIAYGMTRVPRRWRSVLVLLVILPFWTAFLIRVYAWMTLLQREGLLNELLLALGIIQEPLTWLATDTAVYIGIVYSYLPFMVLPLYATLEGLDDTLLEAAADLGAPPAGTFWRITVPLSFPGAAAGSLLCFIPIVGEFVVPDLLGSSATSMIGQTLWIEFFNNRDWPVASAVAIVMLVLLLPPILLYQRLGLARSGGGA